MISWTNHYTCIPGWNAEQAAARFPTPMLATVTSVKRKTPMQQAHLRPWKSEEAFLRFVASNSKGHQLKSSIIIIASAFLFYYHTQFI